MALFPNGLRVEQSMTTPSKPGKKPRPVWSVSGAIGAFEQALHDLGGKKWHGAFSFFEDPSEAIEKLGRDAALSFAERRENLLERAEDRADRLSDAATRHAEIANSAAERAARPGGTWRQFEGAMRTASNEGEYAAVLASRAKHNERKAARELSPRYIDNRLREARANLNRATRRLALPDRPHDPEREHSGMVCTGEWRQQQEAQAAEYAEQVEYWSNLAGEHSTGYDQNNVAAGAMVKVRGRWARVVRANKTTVSLDSGYSWANKYPYAEIQDYCAPGQAPDVQPGEVGREAEPDDTGDSLAHERGDFDAAVEEWHASGLSPEALARVPHSVAGLPPATYPDGTPTKTDHALTCEQPAPTKLVLDPENRDHPLERVPVVQSALF